MTISNAALTLPEEIGVCQKQFDGEPSCLVYLIASEPGHPIKAEKSAYEALQHLHGIKPIDWVFVNFDASEKSGHLDFNQAEIDLGPYRAYTDKAITKGIAEMMINQNILCAGLAFGITSEPRARVQALDDWYCRATQRDALEELNAEAGKIALIDSVVSSLLSETSSTYQDFVELFSLIRLEWTDEEWSQHRSSVEGIDPADRFSELVEMIPEYASVLDHLCYYKKQACRFYEAAIPRISFLASESLRVTKQARATTAAIVVALPWMATAASVLKSENVSFVSIKPAGVLPRIILELPSLNPVDVLEGNKRMTALFSGRPIPGRIQMLQAEQKERLRERSNDWASAGQALSLKYEFKKANECFERALQLDPENAHALWAAGATAADARDYQKALELVERSLQVDPNNAMAWEAKGCALDELGKMRAARKALIRSIYLEPKNGRFWNRLGLHYHNHGMRPQACYSFRVGSECKDEMASQNLNMACSGRAKEVRPLPLHPAAVFLMRRFVRPLGNLWKRRIRWLLFFRAFVIYGALAMVAVVELLTPRASTGPGGGIPTVNRLIEILFFAVAAFLYAVGLAKAVRHHGWASVRWRHYAVLLPTGLLTLSAANLWLHSPIVAWGILGLAITAFFTMLAALVVQTRSDPDVGR